MAISPTDIRFRLSGGASNSVQAASLGGGKSTSYANSSIFDAVSNDELAAGSIEYRCVYIQNENTDLPLDAAVAWVAAKIGLSAIGIALGLGTSAVNGTEPAVGSQTTAPSGVTFVDAIDVASAISLGSIPAGQSRALWIRRTVPTGLSAGTAGFTLRVQAGAVTAAGLDFSNPDNSGLLAITF